jgi:hypothetical protein
MTKKRNKIKLKNRFKGIDKKLVKAIEKNPLAVTAIKSFFDNWDGSKLTPSESLKLDLALQMIEFDCNTKN